MTDDRTAAHAQASDDVRLEWGPAGGADVAAHVTGSTGLGDPAAPELAARIPPEEDPLVFEGVWRGRRASAALPAG